MSLSAQLRRLNPPQREAVEHFEGPLLVLAGPGSGKTRVLTVRAAYLVEEHGVPPDRVLALTFTNRAAGEMRERIRGLLGGAPGGLWTGTFHSFGAWLLRRHGDRLGWSHRFSIYDADESLEQVRRVMDTAGVDRTEIRARGVRAEIESAKHYLVAPDAYEAMTGPDAERFERVCAETYRGYQQSLRRQDAFDFGDLLMKAVELLRDHPELRRRYGRRFSFVLVDEYQDTNHAQYRLVQLLGREHRNVMVVGDDDQSIYGWRGADLRNILEFESDFGGCRTVRLERNYRSTRRILAAAGAVIGHNSRRKEKSLHTERPEGEPVRVVRAGDERAEARWIAAEIERRAGSASGEEPGRGEGREDGGLEFRDFAVLYRTNAQSRALEDAIRRRGIPYQIVGGVRFYERREIRDVLAYLRLISNPRDRAAFERAVNRPRRGIGEVTRSRLLEHARAEGIAPLEAARRATRIQPLPSRGARSLESFADLVDRYRRRAAEAPAAEIVRELVDELDWLQVLKEEGPEGPERAENVEELVAAASEVDDADPTPGAPDAAPEDVDLTPLDRFLQEVALVTEVDRRDPEADAVLLMTLHNSKGLEFPCVFLSGMEAGLCPHARSYGTEEEMEEERRLFYVGLTRARDVAALTHVERRRRHGRQSWQSPSRFLEELPAHGVERLRAGETAAGRRAPGIDDVGASGGGDPERREPSGDGDPRADAGGTGEGWRSLEPGDRVRHPRFGEGQVRAVEEEEEGDPRVVVDFEEEGRKRLAARYATLRRV
jgi:DNA helicase-2/ATP-dependent DNA helicase PcrA